VEEFSGTAAGSSMGTGQSARKAQSGSRLFVLELLKDIITGVNPQQIITFCTSECP